MNILVIGGSYFLGRIFVMQSYREHRITVLNRGNIPINNPEIKEYKLDRHDIYKLKTLPENNYDAIVDFCAYNSGEVKSIIENIPGTIGNYVLISTCDVYKKGLKGIKAENAPLANPLYSGEIGSYLNGKIMLEQEIKCVCKENNIPYAILRPSIIYGPLDYSDRVKSYIQEIILRRKIPVPYDAEGKFQLVYVKDVVMAIQEVLKQHENSAIYNVCPNDVTDYKKFVEVLQKVADIPFEVETFSIDEILEKNLLAPFPLTNSETELYCGKKAEEKLHINYTQLEDGLKNTYDSFKRVFLL